MTRNQYGAYWAMDTPEDIDKANEEVRRLAREQAALDGIQLEEPIEVVRLTNVGEDEWGIMGIDTEWHPGIEVWGWKAFGSKP